MTNWRERGYVPASDGEDDETELSTQRSESPSPSPSPPFPLPPSPPPPPLPSTYIEPVLAVPVPAPAPALQRHKLQREHEHEHEHQNEGGPAESAHDDAIGARDSLDGIVEPDGDEERAPAIVAHPQPVLPADTPVWDLTHQHSLAGQPINDPYDQLITSSPDPLTGEPQFRAIPPRKLNRTPSAGTGTGTVAAAVERQSSPVPSTASSPLSSVPSSPVRTVTPSSSLHPPVSEPRAAFQIVINQNRDAQPPPHPHSPPSGTPVVSATSPFFERSLRNRKPIQLHPYALEDARYKLQMKAKGVQPLRILEGDRAAQEGAAAPSAQDSQDNEYQAPSQEKDSQSPRRRLRADESSARRKASKNNGTRDDALTAFVNAVNRVELRRQKAIARDGTKRRKLAHTSRQAEDLPTTATTLLGGPAASSPPPVPRPTSLYDFPESSRSSSPTGPARSPLRRRSYNSLVLPATSSVPGASNEGSAGGPFEFMHSFLDSDTETVRKPNQASSSPTESRSRPRAISISSDELSAPCRGKSPAAVVVSDDGPASETETEADDDDPSQETNRPPDRPSKVVNFFKKRGTRGVLPASYIRLAEKSRPVDPDPTHCQRPQSSPTPPPEERRPGVARAKISSRARQPVQDLFPSESDDDDGEPVITASVPVRPRKRPPASSPPPRRVISLFDDDGDIPEDNRIDYGLPAPKRQRSTAAGAAPRDARKRIGQPSAARRSHNDGGYANASSAKRKPRQQPSSSGPRLGIVDAAAHLKRSGNRPPPDFLRVAARNAVARLDLGRQSPARKLLLLDTADNTREVQDVLRDWREGTLPFGRTQLSPRPDARDRRNLPSTHRRPQAWLSVPRRRQTSLLHHDFQRQPPSGGRGTAANWRVRPAHTPQFERGIPGSQRLDRQHPTSLIIESVIQDLRQQRLEQRRRLATSYARPVERSVQTPASSPPASGAEDNAPRGPICRRRRRKQTPQRIDAETIERRQPPVQDLVLDDGDSFEPIVMMEDEPPPPQERSCLSGLHPFGSKYSLSFDTSPLKDGTIFNAETFIGRGEFSRALSTPCPRVHVAHQPASYNFEAQSLYWGVYDDSVATEFEAVVRTIGDTAEKRQDGEAGVGLEEQLFAYQAYGFYGFSVNYIADTLSFHDQLDAVSFAQRFLQTIDRFCSRLSLSVFGPSDTAAIRNTNTQLVLQANAFCLVVAFQIFRLTSALPDIHTQPLELPRILRRIGRELVSRLLRVGIDHVRACYEDQRRRTQFERGIGSEHYLAELWVLAIQTLDGIGIKGSGFWDILNDELHIERAETSLDIRTFERLWRTLFTLVPLYQFDDLGLAKRVDDSRPAAENWSMVKVLAGRPLRVYNTNKGGHSGTINHYLRIIYARCSHLITRWHWINPDSIIPVLFEFFSSNGLANLPDEDNRGSPDFLLNLDKDPAVAIAEADHCFHLLLKVIVTGLKRMKTTSSTRKISGLVYRLMPNHRRQYPKDKDLRVEHLDALKNHHYLLETLYWAAPPGSRPPLDAICLLVDPETSHREACTVAIRAWSNLLRFQLRSRESPLPLQELMQWFNDLATKTLGQHQLARSEAEKQFRLVQETESSNVSEQDLEANIRRNQRQLEALLNDLVKSLCLELSSVQGNIPNAIVLLTPAATANILNSYTRLSSKLLLEVLDLLQQFLKTCRPPEANSQSNPSPVNTDEDSQDYGDWSGFEEVIVRDEAKKAAEHFLFVAYDSLHRMLSNCFGADVQPEEALLIKIVDTWTSAAGFLVQYGCKEWYVYLEYSRESWSSLRDTAQTRKFTAYFLPQIIHSGVDIYRSNRSTFLSFWMRSLVERESMLKFQNEFTATLLNVDSANPLLDNPPFERDRETGLFVISQTEFRRRRLPLISSVLEKMRETYKAASGVQAAALKQEYAEMLRAMMKAMKENFEVLKSSTVSGAYVDFVHRVVEFLLQYTADIVELDKFFTDSSAFPLPAMDPNYVVGQLKKYVFGLSFSGTQKQLNAFFQTLSERAALGNEQDGLISQLSVALSEDFERGDPGRPTMRAYFVHAIFPAYIETALEHPAGWVLGVPALRALGNVTAELRFHVDSTRHASTASTISMLATLLDSLRRAASHAMSLENAFAAPNILGTLTLLLRVLAAAIPVLAWLYDGADDADADDAHRETATDCGDFLIRFAAYARKIATGRHDDEAQRPLDILAMSERPASAFEAGRQHCKDSLAQYLASKWRWRGDYGGDDALSADGLWLVGDRTAEQPDVPGLPEFLHTVAEVIRIAARTEVFGAVARDVDLPLWTEEWRSRGPRRAALADLSALL